MKPNPSPSPLTPEAFAFNLNYVLGVIDREKWPYAAAKDVLAKLLADAHLYGVGFAEASATMRWSLGQRYERERDEERLEIQRKATRETAESEEKAGPIDPPNS